MIHRNIHPLALAWLLAAMLGTATAQTAKRASQPAGHAESSAVCVVAEIKGMGLQTAILTT